MDKLKGRRVGVIGGDANNKIVEVLSKEYGLDREKVFKDIALPDARHALQAKEVSALLVVIPLAGKYLSLLRGLLSAGPESLAGTDPDRFRRGDRTKPNVPTKASTCPKARCEDLRRIRKMT